MFYMMILVGMSLMEICRSFSSSNREETNYTPVQPPRESSADVPMDQAARKYQFPPHLVRGRPWWTGVLRGEGALR